MSKPLRFTLALVILVVSLGLLTWAFWPSERIVRQRLIQPTEMQLPTPESSLLLQRELAWSDPPPAMTRSIRIANHFVLIL